MHSRIFQQPRYPQEKNKNEKKIKITQLYLIIDLLVVIKRQMKVHLLSFSFEDSSSDTELGSSPTGSGMTTLLRYVTCQSITWELAKTYHKKKS